jgi:Fur family peroxide stress response transcriptional regulator
MKRILTKLTIRGVTLTPQRIAIVEFLEKTTTHPTVDDIHKTIRRRYPSISMATVYSTLELLKELGEIQELSIRKRGKVCFDFKVEHRHHLLCRRCGRVFDIKFRCPPQCPILKPTRIGGCKIEEVQTYLYGLCPECLKKENV